MLNSKGDKYKYHEEVLLRDTHEISPCLWRKGRLLLYVDSSIKGEKKYNIIYDDSE